MRQSMSWMIGRDGGKGSILIASRVGTRHMISAWHPSLVMSSRVTCVYSTLQAISVVELFLFSSFGRQRSGFAILKLLNNTFLVARLQSAPGTRIALADLQCECFIIYLNEDDESQRF